MRYVSAWMRALPAALALALVASVTAPAPAVRAAAVGQERAAPPVPEAEAAAEALVLQATSDFQRRGYAGLRPHLPGLRQALEKAPASYPLIERQGDVVVIRVDEMEDYLVLSVAAASEAASGREGRAVNVFQRSNIYGFIALLLGSEAVEGGRFDEAIHWLDMGLKLQPTNRWLIGEKAAALQGARRWGDALDLVDAALASGDLLIVTRPAMLLRKRGFSLIELGRLDEAEAAYVESLRSEPDNASALAELDYIRQLRGGAKPTEPIFEAPGANPGG